MLNQWERLGPKQRTGRSLPLLLIEVSTQVVASAYTVPPGRPSSQQGKIYIL